MASIIYKGSVGTGGGGSITWQEKTADFTAQSGYGYFVDSTSPVIVTLPASASIGDTFYVVNVSGSVVFDGLIQGVTSPTGLFYRGTVLKEQIASFYYLDATYGWFCDKDLASFATSDPYVSNIVLYIKGDDVNGSTNVIDLSSTPKTITVNGDAQISTAQSKYGGSSIDLTSTGSHLSVEGGTHFDFGTGDFTVETWIYQTSVIHTYLLDARNPSSSYLFDTLNGLRFVASTTSNASFSFSANQWYHVAVSRSETALRFFVDGVQIGIDYTNASNALSNQTSISIGGDYTGGDRSRCYIDSFRVTKGVARYTANFNPETDTYLAY